MPERPDDLLNIPPDFQRKPEADPALGPTAPPIAMPTGPSPYDARREREAKRAERVSRQAEARFRRLLRNSERDRVFTVLREGATTHGEVAIQFPGLPSRRISAALQALVRTGRIVKLSRKRYKVKE